MKTKTQILLELWFEARTRLTDQLEVLEAKDLTRRLGDAPNSVGFLLRHMGDVELLFAKNVFGDDRIKVTAKTLIEGEDIRRWTDLEELKDYLSRAFFQLKQIVEKQKDSDWE